MNWGNYDYCKTTDEYAEMRAEIENRRELSEDDEAEMEEKAYDAWEHDREIEAYEAWREGR